MEKTLNKLLLTTLRDRRAVVLVSEKRVLQFEFEGEEAAEQIGTIYIGKVRNVVKNLNAAFVEYKPGVNGYYSLNDNHIHTVADGTRSDRPLKSGDEIVVQLSRAAVKTKDAVLSGELTLTGRYIAVLTQKESCSTLGISAKIKDKVWREQIKEQWKTQKTLDSGHSFIIRTNAYQVALDTILDEARILSERLTKLCRDASFRTPYSVLYQPDSFAISKVRDLQSYTTAEIVTDDALVYAELTSCSQLQQNNIPIRFYEDTYPLRSLYHLETELERALGKIVWLKSGGYLVIEPTEAMTVIDVNTGKNVDKKSPEETYFKTNLEAASEIAVQLRLRNISGIIIVDFIDMNDNAHNAELLNQLRICLASDPVKTTLVDMTALGLVEITRKKIHRPLHEQIARSK